MLKTLLPITIFLLVSCAGMIAQSLAGRITDVEGSPLPFATVYLPQQQTGTASNEEGYYRLYLRPGNYRIVYQYLGYKTLEKDVTIETGKTNLDIILLEQPLELQEVRVVSEREDPAYTIMRKAIAKAKFHTQQLDAYTATVYIKGSGRLTGLPFLFRKKIEKAMEEEGIDSTMAFTTESVSEIRYTRPNQYTERVISIRTVGDDNNTSPNNFIKGSFYEPEVSGAVSPLSPKAFAFYRFEYLGEFSDRGYLVNKIRVTPRSQGDNVFEGVIYIVDQLWSIHSLDLGSYIWGIRFDVNQVYAPLDSTVWLPVNNIFDVTGSVFGFRFEYRYFANVDDYNITLNDDLTFEPEIIDDKLENERATRADEALKGSTTDTLLTQLASGDEISRKQLRKLLKEYEEQEQSDFEMQADSLEDVFSITELNIDSSAYSRDSMYWDSIRPMPLTEYEVKGYHVMDSIAHREREEAAAEDTLALTVGDNPGVMVRKKPSFEPMDILLGGHFTLGKNLSLRYESPLLSAIFNTVEGFNGTLGLRLISGSQKKLAWSFGPDLRYGLNRGVLNYRIRSAFRFGVKNRKWDVQLIGGNYVRQINPEEPISPVVNSFMSTLFERNYMKLLERDFLGLTMEKELGDELKISAGAEWQEYRQLRNHSDFSVFDSGRRSYTSNVPFNLETGDTAFEPYTSFQVSGRFDFRPWLRYRIRNGEKYIIPNSSPDFTLKYRTSLSGILESEQTFHHVEAGVKHDFNMAGGAVLNLNVLGGTFLGVEDLRFPDFKHFPGNLTPFATLDPAKSYRLLDYYAFSTDGTYGEAHAYFQMRKFLVTQSLWARLAGLRESLYVNALVTDAAQPYWEAGYGLNYIFRIFRIEVVTSFLEDEYLDWGIRLGIASNLESLFGNQ